MALKNQILPSSQPTTSQGEVEFLTNEMLWDLSYCMKSLSDVHNLFLVEIMLREWPLD